jgi:hypothetical protein
VTEERLAELEKRARFEAEGTGGWGWLAIDAAELLQLAAALRGAWQVIEMYRATGLILMGHELLGDREEEEEVECS